MKYWKLLFTFLAFFLSFQLLANNKVKIKAIDFKKNNETGTIIISLDKEISETPELTVSSKMIQIAIPRSYVWPKIEKRVMTSGRDHDTVLIAYQYDKNLVRFRVTVPYKLEGHENKINLTLKDKKIILNFPIKKINVTGSRKDESLKYDEGYLNKLLSEKSDVKLKNNFFKKTKKSKESKGNDDVNVKQSGTEKSLDQKNKPQFSIGTYIGKFVAFLGVILLFFYGIVHLMKKGVLKRGKLGFLNDTNTVEVLNTTYLGPKKSLLLVKVHKQVLLLSSTEKGLEFLSEVKDTSGLLKEGEDKKADNNFDTSLMKANLEEKKFKIKEVEKLDELEGFQNERGQRKDSEASRPNNLLGEFLSKNEDKVSDKVSLSNQIKNKMKNLKQFQ